MGVCVLLGAEIEHAHVLTAGGPVARRWSSLINLRSRSARLWRRGRRSGF